MELKTDVLPENHYIFSYKTYNVIVELVKEGIYEVEEIEKSSSIREMLKVFNVLYLIGDIYGYLYNKSRNYNGDYDDDEIDIDDISEEINKLIDMLLEKRISLSKILKKIVKYIDSLIKNIKKIKFLEETDKDELVRYKSEIEDKE